MGFYSLALFVVTVLLVCVGSASTVAVAAVPVQETEKPSGTTPTKKHLRAAKATDEDNEDRATRIANKAYFAEKLGKLGSRFSKKAKALNARLFPKTSNEMLTSPLISKKHSSSWGLSDDPRWNEKGDSVGKRDPQPMSVLDDPRWNKEEVTRGFDSVGNHDPQSMLTTPLLSKKHSSSWGLSDDPRWTVKEVTRGHDSVGKRDTQPMSVSDDPRWNKEEVTRGHDSVENHDPQPMNDHRLGKYGPQPMNDHRLKLEKNDELDELHDKGTILADLFKILKMKDDGYKGFEYDKLNILDIYRSTIINPNVPSLDYFVREAVESDEKFVLILEPLVDSERYKWLEAKMLEVFGKWKDKKITDVRKLLNEAEPHNSDLVDATIKRLELYREEAVP